MLLESFRKQFDAENSYPRVRRSISSKVGTPTGIAPGGDTIIRHPYIANPPANALHQIDSYGQRLGYGTSARLVLLHCLQEAWDDGHARMTPTGVAAAVGVSFDAASLALRELAENGEIEM